MTEEDFFLKGEVNNTRICHGKRRLTKIYVLGLTVIYRGIPLCNPSRTTEFGNGLILVQFPWTPPSSNTDTISSITLDLGGNLYFVPNIERETVPVNDPVVTAVLAPRPRAKCHNCRQILLMQQCTFYIGSYQTNFPEKPTYVKSFKVIASMKVFIARLFVSSKVTVKYGGETVWRYC